jgi:hypothetical protein
MGAAFAGYPQRSDPMLEKNVLGILEEISG